MPGVPASDHLACWHAFPVQQVALAPVDAGDLPAELQQDQPGGAGVEAASWSELQGGLADEAQDHAGDGRARRTAKTQGFVQIDDAYLGGERTGGKRGRGSENKQPFVIAVQVDR